MVPITADEKEDIIISGESKIFHLLYLWGARWHPKGSNQVDEKDPGICGIVGDKRGMATLFYIVYIISKSIY